MADGTRRPVEDVRAGDAVMGPDGTPHEVLNTTKGIGQLYEVSQNGGEPYIVNADHVLSLKRAPSARKGVGRKERYTSFGDFANIAVTSYNGMSQRWRDNFFGYRSGAIELPEKDLPIPPYVFGAWLGDGSTDRAELTSMDDEVISAFLLWGSSVGCVYDKRHKPDNRVYGFILVYGRGKGSNNVTLRRRPSCDL